MTKITLEDDEMIAKMYLRMYFRILEVRDQVFSPHSIH